MDPAVEILKVCWGGCEGWKVRVAQYLELRPRKRGHCQDRAESSERSKAQRDSRRGRTAELQTSSLPMAPAALEQGSRWSPAPGNLTGVCSSYLAPRPRLSTVGKASGRQRLSATLWPQQQLQPRSPAWAAPCPSSAHAQDPVTLGLGNPRVLSLIAKR